MSLNLLTRGTIRTEYQLITDPYKERIAFLGGETMEKLLEFFNFFEETFFHSEVWEVHEWCVAGLRIRTNDDMEGKLNS